MSGHKDDNFGANETLNFGLMSPLRCFRKTDGRYAAIET